MTITIPDFKTPSRNKTATKHWRKYQAARNEMASLIINYKPVIQDMNTVNVPLVVDITAVYKSKRSIDVSNIDDKIIVDGLMKAGILEDDSPRFNPAVIKRVKVGRGIDQLVIKVYEYKDIPEPRALQLD